jgi:hypothetical protein
MANYLKASIRLGKISERNNKPHYSHLTPKEKSFVKAFEQVKQCENEMSTLERDNKDWRKTETGQHILGIYSKAIDRKMRTSNQLNLSEEKEFELFNSCHNSRFYGGNY